MASFLTRVRRACTALFADDAKPAAPTRPDFVTIGTQCKIDSLVSFRRHEGTVTIGEKTTVWRNTEFCAPVVVGQNCFINRDVYVRPFTTIGNHVSIGPFVKLIGDSHEISNVVKRAGKSTYKPIVIGDGVWIGAGATVLGGVTLGRGCVVAAGAVVTKNVVPDTIVAGVPARVVRALDPLTDK